MVDKVLASLTHHSDTTVRRAAQADREKTRRADVTDDLWTIVGSSTEAATIKTLADYLTSKSVPCRLCDPQPTSPNTYSLLVPHQLLGEIDRIMDWVGVATFQDGVSAAVMAEKLTLSGIPAQTDGGVRGSGPFNVFVPRPLRKTAKEVIDEPPISDEELTAQALAAGHRHHSQP